MTGHLYPLEIERGAYHMAADDRLLDLAVNGIPSLRVYAWAEPTLSLGYFQKFDERPALVQPLPVVRRSTGGGAIVHHFELTYSVGIPSALAGEEPWGCRMHHMIADVLKKEFGIDSDPVVCGEEKKEDPFLCFHHHTAGDLAMGERRHTRDKVIGSAQRKQHGAILQHGSILLATSPFAPSLPGIAELAGKYIHPLPLAAAITEGFATQTKWVFKPTTWSQDDLAAIRGTIATKYGNEEWTRKR
jgi:lipoate-protein ligase A